ncbi:nucleotidyltransferase domain-containing protein [Nocardioides sp. P5_C9_2]
MPRLDLPAHVSPARAHTLRALADRNDADHGEEFLGLVLSGSAGRGMATERSDLDVLVVLTDEAAAGRRTTKLPDVDEVPMTLAELEELPPFGSDGWWYRWSLAWAPVLLDRTGGALPDLVGRHARLAPDEQREVLLTHDRLDGYVNYAFRALKNDRDGRPLERRLDAAESVPWLLDTIFALEGRVRPYMKYLPWELRTHPLPAWPAEETLDLLERTLDGEARAVRETFGRVEQAVRKHPAAEELTALLDGWGDQLDLLRVS